MVNIKLSSVKKIDKVIDQQVLQYPLTRRASVFRLQYLNEYMYIVEKNENRRRSYRSFLLMIRAVQTVGKYKKSQRENGYENSNNVDKVRLLWSTQALWHYSLYNYDGLQRIQLCGALPRNWLIVSSGVYK